MNGIRTSTLHGFLHAGVSNNQLPVIQDVMTHEFVDEIGRNPAESAISSFVLLKLLQRLGKTMRDLNIFSPDLAHKFYVMIFGYAECRVAIDRFHHKTHNPEDF